AEVVAVDVGYGQLHERLRADPRVEVHERTNIRTLTAAVVSPPVDLVVGDLSFISLTLVLDPLIAVTARTGDLVLMVKPQFEVGRGRVGKGGVVRDPGLRAEAVEAICAAADVRGWGARALAVSRLPGPSGNLEFFVWLRRGARSVDPDRVDREVRAASGPGDRDEKVGR
ncbi:MAG: SAM-dependent methyltransferase, partial [Nocardioidaceae bacterium]